MAHLPFPYPLALTCIFSLLAFVMCGYLVYTNFEKKKVSARVQDLILIVFHLFSSLYPPPLLFLSFLFQSTPLDYSSTGKYLERKRSILKLEKLVFLTSSDGHAMFVVQCGECGNMGAGVSEFR